MWPFAKPPEATDAPGRASRLTPQRIAAALDSGNWSYNIDDEGDANGTWDGHTFHFLRMGAEDDIFMVRGRWEARIPLEMGSQILPVLNSWHKEQLFPKAVLVDFPDDGNSRVFTEMTIDCGPGISDEQLASHIDVGINNALMLFKELDRHFPGLQSGTDT